MSHLGAKFVHAQPDVSALMIRFEANGYELVYSTVAEWVLLQVNLIWWEQLSDSMQHALL
jgi:hypothetical protein